MKRFLSALLIFILLITSLPAGALAADTADMSIPEPSVPEYTSADIQNLPAVPRFDFEFLPAGEKWDAITAGAAPAAFTEVTYQLADGVVVLDNTVSEKIASAGQLLAGSVVQEKRPEKIIREGGFIKQDILNSALALEGRKAEPGTVVVDPQAGTSFKISSSTAFANEYGDAALNQQVGALANTYMIEQPQINEVFTDFSLGGTDGEIVSLTRGNITGFAEGVEDCVVSDTALKPMAFGDALKDYKYLKGDKLINLQFTDKELHTTSGGKQLTVRLSGGLGISGIDVDARYSAFNGYHLIMDVSEEFYLVIEVQGTIQQEIRLPLFGIDIPFGIGRVSGGISLIVGVDGDIRIEADAREYASVRMGVKGKTFFGAPVSVKGVFDKEFKKDGDVDIAGRINGYVKVGPLLDISICGLDLIGAGAFVGVGLDVTSENKILDIDLHAILQVYIKIIGKTVNLIHWKPSLLHKRQMDTGGYRVSIQEAYIKIGRVGGYIEDTRSINKIRAPEGIGYRILVYPKGVNPLSAAESDMRIYPQEGWLPLSDEGEFFYEEPETLLKGGEQVAVQFTVDGETYKSDPVPALFPYNRVTIAEADYFNDFVTGSVAPVKVIDYSKQQVAKPGDPADPPEVQYMLKYYSGSPLHLQGLSGYMINVAAKTTLAHGVYMPVALGGMATVKTDEYGNFDSRNPQMLPDGAYEPVFNGTLQIRPGAVVLGGGKFDYSKNKNISAVKASFDVLEHTSSHTIMLNPTHPLTVARTVSFVEDSEKTYHEGERIVNQMQFDETMTITNGGGTRAVSQAELAEFFEDGWTTQDVIGFKGGKFLGENDDAQIVSHTVGGGGHFTVIPVLDEDGKPTSSVMVQNRVIVEWVWQEHPLPTKIISADHAAVIAGGSFQAEGSGIRPFYWSLQNAPEGITMDPATGKITVAAGMKAQNYSFKVRLEQDPAYFQTERLKSLPMSNETYSFGLNKTSLDQILDFNAQNFGNPAMNGEPPINFIGNDPAPPDEQLFTLTVTRTAETTSTPRTTGPVRTPPDIAAARHGYRFSMTAGEDNLNVVISATGSTPITWSLTPTDGRRIPPEIAIDAQSGLLTAQKNLAGGTYPFTVRAENDVGSDTQECVLTVAQPAQTTEPARTPPDIAAADHGYRFTITTGVDDLRVGLSASGSTPIIWSLIPADGRRIPPEIAIDAQSGLLTAQKSLAAGTYSFTVQAENDAGHDTQECVLTVAEIRTAPVIAQEEHGYVFTKLIGGGDLTVPVTASGSAPITWSLEKKSERYMLPEQVTIDPVTGVLTIKEGIEAGEYHFLIRAENDMGFDTRECTLKVISLVRPPRLPGLAAPSDGSGQVVFLSAVFGVTPRLSLQTPVNSTTIRVDHSKDRYTYDRDHINGAEFIRWNSVFKLNIEGSPEEMTFAPGAERCDSYHIYIDMSDPALQTIITDRGKKIQDIKDAQEYLAGYLRGQHDQYVINPWQESALRLPELQAETAPFDFAGVSVVAERTLLNYGSTVDAIASEKGGLHNVTLGGDNGTSVTGKFFSALAQNPAAGIAFQQAGAVITFQGRNITDAGEDAMFDFGFIPQAEHGEQMKAALPGGHNAFVYSFLGHGELPGTAVFAITTDIAEGTRVNVYLYDALANNFTLIAGNLAVGAGGVVTYQNNTMSEYLITTAAIKGAGVSDMAARQDAPQDPQQDPQPDIPWLWLAGAGLAAVLAGLLFWNLRRRKTR